MEDGTTCFVIENGHPFGAMQSTLAYDSFRECMFFIGFPFSLFK